MLFISNGFINSYYTLIRNSFYLRHDSSPVLVYLVYARLHDTFSVDRQDFYNYYSFCWYHNGVTLLPVMEYHANSILLLVYVFCIYVSFHDDTNLHRNNL